MICYKILAAMTQDKMIAFEGCESPKFIKLNPLFTKKTTQHLLKLIKKYCPDYEKIPDDLLFDVVSHPIRLRNRQFPKIALQKALNGDVVAFSVAVPKEVRKQFAADFQKEVKTFITTPGQNTIEFGLHEVSKAVAIRYINKNFSRILDAIQYQALPHWSIDAKKYNTVIISDADSTLYGSPLHSSPNALMINNLSNSKAKDSILNYLGEGGVLIVCTGMDIDSVAERLLAGFPKDKMELTRRLVIMSSGGATLNYFNSEGKLVEFSPYRKEALGIEPTQGKVEFDAVYMGDDHYKTGNDYPAFSEIGFDRSIVVSPADPKQVPPELHANLMGFTEQGTGVFLQEVIAFAKQSKGDSPLFSPEQIQTYIREARQKIV